MSSKSHVILTNNLEIYQETNESREVFGKFIGFDVYIAFEHDIVKSFKVKDDYFYVKLSGSDFGEILNLKFYGAPVVEIDYDEFGLAIVLKGGSIEAEKIIKKDFQYFNADTTELANSFLQR